MRMVRVVGAVAVLLASIGVGAASAFAASGPLRAATPSGATRALQGHRVTFALPRRWVRARTVSRGALSGDTYVETTEVGAISCRILLTVSGTLRRAVPPTPKETIETADGPIAVTSRGRKDTTRWYFGTAQSGPAAVAIGPAPVQLRRHDRRAVFVQLTLTPEDPGAGSVCAEAIRADRTDLRSAARTARAK